MSFEFAAQSLKTTLECSLGPREARGRLGERDQVDEGREFVSREGEHGLGHIVGGVRRPLIRLLVTRMVIQG